eukprot:11172382-Lingulodinium_polyedra.AAC.1
MKPKTIGAGQPSGTSWILGQHPRCKTHARNTWQPQRAGHFRKSLAVRGATLVLLENCLWP